MKQFNKNPICEECGKNEAISFSFFEDKQAMRTRLPDLEEFDALFESPAVAVWEVSALIDRLEAIRERKKSALIKAKLAAIAESGGDPREIKAAAKAAFAAVHSAVKNTVRYRTLADMESYSPLLTKDIQHRRVGLSALIKRAATGSSGTWKFTCECTSLTEDYYIMLDSFFSCPGATVDWLGHMNGKSFMNWHDFMTMMERFQKVTDSFGY